MHDNLHYEIFPELLDTDLSDPMPDRKAEPSKWEEWFSRATARREYEDAMSKEFAEEIATQKRSRLAEGLDAVGVSGRGRVKIVAARTGYSGGRVSDLLAGKVPLNDRFLTAVAKAFGINKEWIEYGCDDSPMLVVKEEVATGFSGVTDVAIQEAIKEMLKMSEADRWAVVAEIKRKNQ